MRKVVFCSIVIVAMLITFSLFFCACNTGSEHTVIDSDHNTDSEQNINSEHDTNSKQDTETEYNTDHIHDYLWVYNEYQHWQECSCNNIINKNNHDWDDGIINAQALDNRIMVYSCNTCGKKREEIAYKVVFYDYDDTILQEEVILSGASVYAPEHPERMGYRFEKWDKSFDIIQSDLNIYAQYVQTFNVTFVDYDNTIIDSQTIDINTSASEPDIPEREGYYFTEWDSSFEKVTEDFEVKALYGRLYTVTFFDYNGAMLNKQSVKSYEEIIMPNEPEREGYDFAGWESSSLFDNTNYDIYVTAVYQIKVFTVRFLMPDDTLINEQYVPYGYFAEEPEIESIIYDKIDKKCYSFTKWSSDFSSVYADLDVKAVYKTSVLEASIMIFYALEGRKANVEIYIVGESITFYGMYLNIESDLAIDSYTLKGEHMKEGVNAMINVDVSGKKVELTYSASGQSTQVDKIYKIIDLTFTVPLAMDSFTINILPNSYYISESLNKNSPIVVCKTIRIDG